MDAYHIFRPLIYISRAFCLAPFALIEHSGSTKYQLSKFWFIYSILGVCISIIFQMKVLLTGITVDGSVVMNATGQVMIILTCLSSIASQVLCVSNGRNVIRVLDQISILDRDDDNVHLNYCRVFKVFILLIMYTVISIVVPHIFFFAALKQIQCKPS
jgi:hypothetical protein